MLETFQYQVFSHLSMGKINCRSINIKKNVYNWKCQRRIIGNIQFMVLWTHSIPTVIFREDCLTNRWKLTQAAAAVVLWSPDKTIQKYSSLCVLSLSLFPSSRSHLCLSSNNTSSFSPCKHVYRSIWPQPNSLVEAFCLGQSHRRAVVECGAHGPGQIELNALPGSEETQLLYRKTGYVWINVP